MGQGVHGSAWPTELPYFPASHNLHEEEPALDALPTGHTAHAVRLLLPKYGFEKPAGQGVHDDDPALLA